MTSLALVSYREPATDAPSAQWAQDVRNLLATIGLHLDILARFSGPNGAKSVNAAHSLVEMVGRMCCAASDNRHRRHPFDVAAIVRHVVDLVGPPGPDDCTANVECSGAHFVLADPNDVFRILFNLVHNPVKVARTDRALRRIDISIARVGKITEVKIADDGHGLSEQVVARLFRGAGEDGAAHGYGIAIARELAERSGAILTCGTSREGTICRLGLAALTSIGISEALVAPSLGRRGSS
jgi:signal transduction histidine kinase